MKPINEKYSQTTPTYETERLVKKDERDFYSN